jgi:hypothetical protein
MKKSKTENFLKKFKDELMEAENFKKNEESLVFFLKKKLEEKVKTVESLKGKKGVLEMKDFLATQKLASEKKNGSLSPVKSRGFKVSSPKKNRRTKSTVKNK